MTPSAVSNLRQALEQDDTMVADELASQMASRSANWTLFKSALGLHIDTVAAGTSVILMTNSRQQLKATCRTLRKLGATETLAAVHAAHKYIKDHLGESPTRKEVLVFAASSQFAKFDKPLYDKRNAYAAELMSSLQRLLTAFDKRRSTKSR